MLSELHSLNLKLCIKQYNKKFVLYLIVVPQLSSGRQANQGKQAGPMSSLCILLCLWLSVNMLRIVVSPIHLSLKEVAMHAGH